MNNGRKEFAIYAITRHGIGIAERLKSSLSEADLYVSEKLISNAQHGAIPLPLPMGPALEKTFSAFECHVFVISVGAVVRMIAPLLQSKKKDPAVICVDDAAQYAICVLSGHVGRGNVFAECIANVLGAQAVITTASDVRGTLTVDILGRESGWTLDDPDRNVTRGCAAVVNAEPVLFVQETGEPDWWPLDQPLPEAIEYAPSLDGVDPAKFAILLIASHRDLRRLHPAHFENAVIYRPKSLVLGLGCDRDTPVELVERGIRKIMHDCYLNFDCIKIIASIDKKKDEPALLAVAERFGWSLQTYTAEDLNNAAGIENPSAMVMKHVGAAGVAEPAALLAAGTSRLLVPKQKYTEEGAGHSMTMAVAEIPFTKRNVSAYS